MENTAPDHVAEPVDMQTLLSALKDEYLLTLTTGDNDMREFGSLLFPNGQEVPAFHSDPVEDPWEKMYLKLKDNVKNGYAFSMNEANQLELTDWLNRQIVNRPHLSDSQFRKLDMLGVSWDLPVSRDHAWEIMFTRIQVFKTEFGHCRVPSQWARDKQLALWVMRQRKMYTQGRMLEYRKRRLEEVGFIWDVRDQYDQQWEDHFKRLKAFCDEHGHCLVPGKEKQLVSWVERQRLAHKKGLLLSRRKKRLDEINFIWDFDNIKENAWDEKYGQLRSFYERHGHSFVPVNYKDNRPLGTWVALQRKAEARGTLSKVKLGKLNKLDFVWSRDTLNRLRSEYDSQWEQNFDKLVAYRKAHGTCQVSLKLDPVLQSWTIWQRRMYYAGKMPADRIRRLNGISFPWSINQGYWQRMFGMLAAFHAKFGHCRVPSQWLENPGLAAWVYRVRAGKYKLSARQLQLLNTLGFEWSLQKKTVVEWSEMYSRLLAFKAEYGHTKVPVRWHLDLKLGKWVSRMRHERAKLSAERLVLLEKAGFFSPSVVPLSG